MKTLATLLVITIMGSAFAFAEDFNFEEAILFPSWRGDRNSTLELTGERYKSGCQSLRWSWKKNDATLTFHGEDAFAGVNGNNAFGLWVYNEKPSTAPMYAEFLKGEKVVLSCWFWMDYRGWRSLGATYEQIGWKRGTTIDGVRLRAPKGMENGRLYVDCANFKLPPAAWHAVIRCHGSIKRMV